MRKSGLVLCDCNDITYPQPSKVVHRGCTGVIPVDSRGIKKEAPQGAPMFIGETTVR